MPTWRSGALPDEARPDRILLRGLRVMALCGVLPEERTRRQPFELDLDVVADLRAAGGSDALDDTIDYGALVDGVVGAIERGSFELLEALAATVADVVLTDERVDEVTVEVHKLRPPVPHDLGSSGVRITRARG